MVRRVREHVLTRIAITPGARIQDAAAMEFVQVGPTMRMEQTSILEVGSITNRE